MLRRGSALTGACLAAFGSVTCPGHRWPALSPKHGTALESASSLPTLEGAGGIAPRTVRVAAGFGPAGLTTRSLPRLAVAEIEGRVYGDGEHADPTLGWDLGIARLSAGDVDGAVSGLEAAALRDPSLASLAADLGAALYVRGQRDRETEDLVRAADVSARAVRLNPELQQPRFNLALALEEIGWREQAVDGWRRYLDADNTSPWAAHARQRLAALGAARMTSPSEGGRLIERSRASGDWPAMASAARETPEGARMYVEETLLPAWARQAADPAHCGSWTRTAETIGSAVLSASHDRLLADLSLDLRDACAAPGSRRREIAAAIDALSRSRTLAEAGDMGEAARQARQAATGLVATRALSRLAGLSQIFADFTLQPPQQLAPRLAAARAAAARSSHTYLVGRLSLAAGSVALRLAHRGEALDLYRAAAGAFERAREIEYTASTAVLIGQSLKEQGNYRQAWPWLFRGIRLLDGIDSPRRQFFVVHNVVEPALEEGLVDLVRLFQSALFVLASEWGDSTGWVTASLIQARALAHIGDLAAARTHVTRARQHLGLIEDRSYRRELEIQIAVAEGLVEGKDDPERAVASLTRALEHFAKRGFFHVMAETYLRRGQAHATLGRLDEAEADWRAGIEVFEDQRPEIRDEQLRISHMSQLWDLFGEMIRSRAVRRNQPEDALPYIERSRARALLDSLGPRQRMRPGDPIQIVRQLPGESTVLVYTVLDEVVLATVLTKSDPQHFRLSISRAELSVLIERFRFQIEHGLSDQRTGGRLHDLLLGPLRQALEPGRTLLIVPDGPLEALPFSALVDTTTGRRVIADFPVGMAPSVTLLGLASKRMAERDLAPERLIVVGDPAFNERAVGRLPRLPDAEQEATDVAQLYASAVLLTGGTATRAHFLAEIRRASVIHFAGHAVADGRFPARSFLLLAEGDEPDREGKVMPADIAALDLRHTRLAVLSACRTAWGASDRGEGVMSLARPFLVAGVPQVVASLWDVDDAVTRRVLTAFHRRLGAGETVLDALRGAQLQMLEGAADRNASRSWAAFVVIGGFDPAGAGSTGKRRM